MELRDSCTNPSICNRNFPVKVNLMTSQGVVTLRMSILNTYDDVIKWKCFQRYWPFARRIHRSPVNSPHKGQWCGALMFSLICAWINEWVNNHEAGDLRHNRAHYDVIVMLITTASIPIGKTPYHQISRNIEAVNYGFKFFLSFWNCSCFSTAKVLRTLEARQTPLVYTLVEFGDMREFLNLRLSMISIFQQMDKIFWVEFHMVVLKF